MPSPPTITAIADSVRTRERSAADITRETLDHLRTVNDQLHAFLETCESRALERAEAIDKQLEASSEANLPLAGVPIAIKDSIVTDFARTTAGSRMLENYTSPFNATVIDKLEAAGAIIIGKTALDEFSMGSSGEHCAFGPTKNPWDTSRVTGGSSSGSAAAVAAGICPAALGSDTGGSIRLPAAFCGTVGVKPTYGRVSRYGLIAYGSSLEQIGPITNTVADAALMLRILAGRDERDSTSADESVPPYETQLDEPTDNLRLGVPKQFMNESNDPAVTRMMEQAIETFRSIGAETIDIDMPMLDVGLSTYYIIAPAEASSNLARYDGIRYGHRTQPNPNDTLDDLYARSRTEALGQEVRRRIMLGTYVLSAGYYDQYYTRALKARRLIKQEFDEAFKHCHAIIGPTSTGPAFPLGEKADPLSMYLCDVYTVNANIAGHCAISLPAGFADAGGTPLPLGLHIQCKAFDETTMFQIAHQFVRETSKRPSVQTSKP